MKYLLLWLEGPLQAWGFESKFDLRGTFDFPTMSGVFGLLMSASGDSGSQSELLKRMSDADFTAVQFHDPTQENTPSLCDYHMVGSGYDKSNKREALHILRTRDGKVAVGGGAKQTYRYYLQNKKFGVIVGFPGDLAEYFAAALESPRFDLYLGRKCCIPTDFIYRGIFADKSAAQTEALKIAAEKSLVPKNCFVSADPEQEDSFFLYDVPLSFGEVKSYADRCVAVVPFTVE